LTTLEVASAPRLQPFIDVKMRPEHGMVERICDQAHTRRGPEPLRWVWFNLNREFEFRTDADVRDAIETGNDDGVLGWMGARGEIGDQPIAMAGAVGNLSLVFQEILSSAGGGRLPVQFLYSNAVHGGEGPIDRPDPPAQT
jgi:hypothetical protein